MVLKRFIIWTTDLKSNNIISKSLESYSTISLIISDTIICVETDLSGHDIRDNIDSDIEIACIELDDDFINKLSKTKLNILEKTNFNNFIELTYTPKSIDEALDLIILRGGINNLHQREVECLDTLIKDMR
jgi:hypothetical protein